MKMEHDTEKLCEMKKTLMCWSEAEIAKGQYGENHCDAEALGEVIDMIKDLAEAEEKCIKACYYKCLIKKLHDGDFDEDDEWEDVEEMNERYGYPRGSHRGGNSYAARSARASAMPRTSSGRFAGYTPDDKMPMDMMHGAADYIHDWTGVDYPMRSRYEDYKMAKKHYHESGKDEDRKKLEEKEHLAYEDAIATMKDMIKDANPAQKQKLEAGIQNLMMELKKA